MKEEPTEEDNREARTNFEIVRKIENQKQRRNLLQRPTTAAITNNNDIKCVGMQAFEAKRILKYIALTFLKRRVFLTTEVFFCF